MCLAATVGVPPSSPDTELLTSPSVSDIWRFARPLISRFATRPVVLRAARTPDLANIRNYLLQANDPHLGLRSAEDLARSVMTGIFYIFELRGEIIGIAGVFPMVRGDGTIDFELGCLHVKREYRGFGLQTLLMPLGVAAATITDARPSTNIYAGIKRPNPVSEKNTKDAGFEEVTGARPFPAPCETSTCSNQAAQPPGGCCGAYFQLPPPKRCVVIRGFLRNSSIRLFSNKEKQWLFVLMDVHLLASPFSDQLADWIRDNCGPTSAA